MSRATSPQTLLQSSCLRFAGGLTRSPAAVLKKISLEGRAERGTFQKSLSTQCWRLRFSKGSQRVLGVHWGPAPTLGCCGAPSSPSGHLPEQRVQRSPSQTSAHQPPCCQPGKPGAGLRSPPTNPSPLLPHRGLTSPVWPPKFQDSPSHLHRWQAPGHREPGSAMQSTEAEVAKLTAAGQGASSLSNPNPVSSRLCTLAKRLNLFGLPFSHL